MVGFLKRSHFFFKTVPPQYQNDWLEKIETCSWANTVKAKLSLRLSEFFFSIFFLGLLNVGKTV